MDSNSSDEEEDSDVFYSCDSESLVSNSPIKASIINSVHDDEEESIGTLPETESCDPISLNIMRKLSISSSSSNLTGYATLNNDNIGNDDNNNTTNNNPATVIIDRPSDSTKVRFAESHITYNIEQLEEELYDYETDSDSDGEKENRKVGVELKKVFTKIITKAEEVQKNVVSRIETRIERKKDKDIQLDQSKALSQSPTKWLKDLIVPTRNPSLQLPKNAVTSFMRRKNKREFGSLVCVQTIDVHEGAIWTMKYSYDGSLMASGGQDGFLRVWKVNTNKLFGGQAEFAYFQKPPANVFHGHTGDILDISWAKGNKKLLSASMDRTVRLWQLDQEESVYAFQHTDIVTSVTFHPVDENIFLSGSLDNKLSLWNIEQKATIKTIDTQEFITTVSFTLDGKLAIAGLHSGMCRFFSSENLAPSGKIYVHSSRGKNKKGKKISGIEALPDGKTILITSNDSRIRLYKLDDFTCECKYKGLVNNSFQIKATSSANGNHVICGSEDNVVYIWNTHNDNAFFSPTDSIPIIGSGTRKDVNASYECFPANTKQPVVVTVALFAPHPPPPSKSIDDQLQATSPSTSPPDSDISSPSSTTSSTPIPAPNSTTKKSSTSSTSPPTKVLPHRNSISSIFSLITPNSLNKSSAKSVSSHSSSSSSSSSSSPSPSTSKPSTPDGATSSHANPISSSDIHPIAPSPPPLPSNSILSTSPPPSSTINNNNNNATNNPNKKATGVRANVFGNSVDMVVDDQLVYIVTADASGQIRVFENLPLQYLSLTLSASPTTPSSSHALSPPTPIPTSAPVLPSPLAGQSFSSPPPSTSSTSSSSPTPSPTSSSNGSATGGSS